MDVGLKVAILSALKTILSVSTIWKFVVRYREGISLPGFGSPHFLLELLTLVLNDDVWELFDLIFLSMLV